MNRWPLARYRFRVRMDAGLTLPAFSGSLLRSVFGCTLKHQVCLGHRDQPCPETCAYRVLFEPAIQPGERFTDAPPPLIFQFTEAHQVTGGDYLEFTQILLGPALDYLTLVTEIWRQAFVRGIGRNRITGQLVSVALEEPEGFFVNKEWLPVYSSTEGRFLAHQPGLELPCPEPSGDLTLHLQTPLRLMESGRLLEHDRLTTESFAKALLRRIQQVNHLYLHQAVPDWWQFRTWFEPVVLSGKLRKIRLNRYSSRQQQAMPLTGVLGDIHLTGVCSELQLWLMLGQYLHLGKNSTFGLGQYQLVSGCNESHNG